MSHTTRIKGIKIMDVVALEAAIKELSERGMKISLLKDATPRSYYTGSGRTQEGMGKADYVVKLDSSRYDIGLYKQDDGSYEARTDFWGTDVEKVLGARASKPENKEQAKLGKLYQAYGIHAAIGQARKKGLTVRRVPGTNGEEKLVLTGFA